MRRETMIDVRRETSAGPTRGWEAHSRPEITSDEIKHVRNILKELVNRTKDFQNLNAFRLFILQHNTYDVDKATMLIKQGKWPSSKGKEVEGGIWTVRGAK
ncbi:hypothetical protein QTP88_006784 [Uroleucon formosanum]